MYENVNPKEAAEQASKIIEERLRDYSSIDETLNCYSLNIHKEIFSKVSKIVENIVFSIQSDYQQREHLLRSEIEKKDSAYGDLTQQNEDLKTSLKGVLELSFEKEICYLKVLKMVHGFLQTSCKFDEDSGILEYEVCEPERQRYESLLELKNRVGSILEMEID